MDNLASVPRWLPIPTYSQNCFCSRTRQSLQSLFGHSFRPSFRFTIIYWIMIVRSRDFSIITLETYPELIAPHYRCPELALEKFFSVKDPLSDYCVSIDKHANHRALIKDRKSVSNGNHFANYQEILQSNYRTQSEMAIFTTRF